MKDTTCKLLNHIRLWCGKEDICVSSSNPQGNLKVHQDGIPQVENGSSACPEQNWAIAAGANLPSTVADIKAIGKKKTHSSLTSFGIEQSKTSTITASIYYCVFGLSANLHLGNILKTRPYCLLLTMLNPGFACTSASGWQGSQTIICFAP